MMTTEELETLKREIHACCYELGLMPQFIPEGLDKIISQWIDGDPWLDSALVNFGQRIKSLIQENAALKKSPWVSVKEKLPDFGDPVFVAGGFMLEQRCCRVGVEYAWKWMGQFSERWSSELFSHWMPIPELPDPTIEEKAMKLRTLILRNHPEAKELMPKEKNE